MADPEDPLAPDDEVEQSPEEAALARVRAHLAEMDAAARLGDELGEPADAAAPPAPVKPAARTREEADAEALAEFQRLRERGSKKTL